MTLLPLPGRSWWAGTLALHGRAAAPPGGNEHRALRGRHAPAPLHGRARRADRDRLAGPLGGRGHVPQPQPRRRPERRVRQGGRPAQAVRARHVPVPERGRAARRPPARLHRHRRLRPLPAHDRPQRPAHHGLRRLRPAGRAVRGADRPAPAHHHRGQHRHHAPPAAAPGPGPRPPPVDLAPPTRASTAGPSGSSCRSSTPGTTPTPTGPGPSPSWWPSWTPASASRARAPTRTAAPWADLSPTERRVVVDAHRLAYLQRGAGQLVPGPGHGAGQRGGHRRRPQRARQLPRVPAAAEAVDDAHHRLRRPADRRPRRARLARGHQAACSATGSAAPRAPTCASHHRSRRRGRPADRGVHHPARHAVRRHLHGAGPRASPRRAS